MKTIATVIALALSATGALAQSTTAKVPTGYQVAGATDYRLVGGPNWTVQQVKDKCGARELGRSDTKCVTVGAHSESAGSGVGAAGSNK